MIPHLHHLEFVCMYLNRMSVDFSPEAVSYQSDCRLSLSLSLSLSLGVPIVERCIRTALPIATVDDHPHIVMRSTVKKSKFENNETMAPAVPTRTVACRRVSARGPALENYHSRGASFRTAD
jgi:hypothetical protein